MILIVDNYDSFTYNLVQRLGELDASLDLRVFRNDEITLEEIQKLGPSHIVISPGPCTPNEAGISVAVIREFAGKVPLLGVCLGHQAIGQAFGGTIVRAPQLMHGKTDQIIHSGKGIFAGIQSPMIATRYHSLVIDPNSLPPELEVTAWIEGDDREYQIMGVRHKQFDVEGLQFHPESFLTEHGPNLLANFLGKVVSSSFGA